MTAAAIAPSTTPPATTESNVFFNPMGRPIIAMASDENNELVGVAQLMRVELTEAASQVRPPVAAFVQNVAVAASARRQGVGSALMRWCEDRASDN